MLGRLKRSKIKLIGVGSAFLIGGYCLWAISPLFHPLQPVSSTKILDREGGLLYEVGRSDEGVRTVIPFSEIPLSFRQAIVSAEDRRFFDHHGVDVLAIIRAAKDLVRERRVVSGASTLEQQLVKMLYFPGASRTVGQKIREAVCGIYWSFTHSKQETLAMYANTAYFGNQAYGIEAASRTYFHKSADALSMGESAMLAGIVRSPSVSEPIHHLAIAKHEQARVIDRLLADEVWSMDQANEARSSTVQIFRSTHLIRAPHFVFAVLRDAEHQFPSIEDGGYIIHTTLDPDLQRATESIVSRRLIPLADQHVTDGAALIANPTTGDVLAYVGSADYFNDAISGQVDMVQAERQPGSALKPFLYVAALMNGAWTPSTVFADLPVRFSTSDGKSYYPRNYGYRYHGPVTFRQALGSSLNIPAVILLDQYGIGRFMGVLSRFGIPLSESPGHYGLGLVLGGAETSLFHLVTAYARLALYGQSVDLVMISDISSADGSVLFSRRDQVHEPLFSDVKRAQQASWLLSDILSDSDARSLSFGEASLLDVGKRVAVKTGTTKDFRDNWAVGYTPKFVVGVWVGNADNTPMQGVSGITGAVPIWHDLVRYQLNRSSDVRWPSVNDLVKKEICVPSGKIATTICPRKRVEMYIHGTEPTEVDDWYVSMDVDRHSGLLATDRCRDTAVTKVYLEPPGQFSSWFQASGYETPPEKDCDGHVLTSGGTGLIILSPLDGDAYTYDPKVDPTGSGIPFIAGGPRQSSYRWMLNNQSIVSSEPTFFWPQRPGSYELRLEGASRGVHFSVQ